MTSPFNFALTPSMPVTPEGMFPAAQAGAVRPGFLQRFQEMRRNNPEALIALGAGMMQGDMAGGFMAAGQQMANYRKRMAEEQQKNQTAEYISRKLKIPMEDALVVAQDPRLLQQALRPDGEQFFQPVRMRDPKTGEVKLFMPSRSGGGQVVDTGGLEVPNRYERHDLGDRIGIFDTEQGSYVGFTPRGGAPSADQRPTADGGLEAIPGSTKALEQGKTAEASRDVSGTLRTLVDSYLKLDEMGAIVNPDRGAVENLGARTSSSGVGQTFGGAVGTEAQSIRERINNIRPILIQQIRQATGMSARGMDSNRELEFYLQAATDPSKDIYSNLVAIQVLDDTFGLGGILERSLPPDMLARVRSQAQLERSRRPIVITPDQMEGATPGGAPTQDDPLGLRY